MLEKCPTCGTPLINGKDGKQMIEYPTEARSSFEAGTITLEELNHQAIIYYNRPRLCPNQGNNESYMIKPDGEKEFTNPPCPQWYGHNGGTLENPQFTAETLKIIDS